MTSQNAHEQTPNGFGERITEANKLANDELGLIFASLREPHPGSGRVERVWVYPTHRLASGSLLGVFRCPQCAQAHEVGLSDFFVRTPACRGMVAPGAARIDMVRTVWGMPHDCPAGLRDEVERPEVGFTPAMFADELQSITNCLRERKHVSLSERERRRLVVILRHYVKSNAFETVLAERLDGGEARREVAEARRNLLREVYRRHAGPGRSSALRIMETAVRALNQCFFFGAIW